MSEVIKHSMVILYISRIQNTALFSPSFTELIFYQQTPSALQKEILPVTET
jgi:hypothetical protein